MRYRKSNKTWYWVGCIDFWNSFIYTASSPSGPWTRSASLWARCYYDCGLFIDDDDTMYVVHGNNNVNVTQLAPSGLSEVNTQPMASNPAGFDGMEGNRMYKRNGIYYILNDSGSGQITWIWRSTSPFGPWTNKVLQQNSGGPVAGGGTPHQGSLVETPQGNWYFVSFTWAYPLGRIPVIAPVTWGSDGWPILGLVSGNWAQTYPNPLPQVSTPAWTGTDSFTGTTLGPRWEWNHNPDTTKVIINNGVTLSAATVTNDLYLARNTLTHRFQGGTPIATIVLDTTNLADGDRAGLAAFRDWTAYIGVVRSGNSYSVVMRQGMTLSTSDWSTTSTGTDAASAPVAKGKIWLRGLADARSEGAKQVTFQYSTDGTTFTPLGGAYTLQSDWAIFIGYRWGIFNHATKALGGSVKLISFNQV
jgi:beta-xylosidase